MTTTTYAAGELIEMPGIRFGGANAAIVLALFGAAAMRLPHPATQSLVAVVVVVSSIALPPLLGTAVGIVGWAFYTGFAEHRFGVLTFDRTDLLRLVLLAALGTGMAISTGRSRSVPTRRGPRSE